MRIIQLLILIVILVSCGHNKIRYSNKKDFETQKVVQQKEDPSSVVSNNEEEKVSTLKEPDKKTSSLEIKKKDHAEQITERSTTKPAKTKSAERVRAEEIAQQLKEKLNPDSEEEAAQKQGTKFLIIGIVLLLLSLGLLIALVNQPDNPDTVDGCLQTVISIIVYSVAVFAVGIVAILLIILGIVVLTTGKKMVRNSRRTKTDDSKNLEKENINPQKEIDPITRQKQKTTAIIILASLILILVGLVIFL